MKAQNEITQINIVYEPKVNNTDRTQIKDSKDVYDLIRPDWKEINVRESMKAIYMNRASKVLGIYELSSGGLSTTIVDIRLLFSVGLKALAQGIILVHNHPSGTLNPSDRDIEITNKVKEGGKLLDITLLDHVIITEDSYLSFSDQGII